MNYVQVFGAVRQTARRNDKKKHVTWNRSWEHTFRWITHYKTNDSRDTEIKVWYVKIIFL